MLRVDTTAPDGTTTRGLAYGDAWVERDSGQASWLKIDVDGRTQVPKVVGDGLLVATPSGSSGLRSRDGRDTRAADRAGLTLAGSNVFRPRFWKPVALPRRRRCASRTSTTATSAPSARFLDGHLAGPVTAMEVRISSVAAVGSPSPREFDLSERLLRSLFPPEEGDISRSIELRGTSSAVGKVR